MKKWLFLPATLCLVGCFGAPDLVRSTSIDPESAAAGAMEQYDADGNGKVSKAECDGSGLSIEKWDANSDGSIDENEIANRLTRYAESGVGMLGLVCTVTLNNKPLEGAKVVFDPEPFMGDSIEAAEGTADIDGNVMLAIPEVVAQDPVLTGVRPGLYKVRITHPDITIAAKYNDETTLGFDASPIEVLNTPVFRLRR